MSVFYISKKCSIMNFQLGIFSKGYNDDAHIHKSFTYQKSLTIKLAELHTLHANVISVGPPLSTTSHGYFSFHVLMVFFGHINTR